MTFKQQLKDRRIMLSTIIVRNRLKTNQIYFIGMDDIKQGLNEQKVYRTMNNIKAFVEYYNMAIPKDEKLKYKFE